MRNNSATGGPTPVDPPGGDPLLALAPALLRLAVEAGARILEVYETDFAVDTKRDSTPITEADRRSHEVITRGLAELTAPPPVAEPLPVLSEEGRDIPYEERRRWRELWMVDPLDGTREFVSRNGEFTVNIAMIRQGRPVLGVVYAPVPDVLYLGAAGAAGGSLYKVEAARGGEEEGRATSWVRARRVPPPSGPAGSRVLRVAGSRSHRSADFDRYVDELGRGYDDVEVVTAGSSLKFCLVAEGRVDVYPRFGRTMEWDTAAGHAVALAAGRRVRVVSKDGAPTDRELSYNKAELINDWFVCR